MSLTPVSNSKQDEWQPGFLGALISCVSYIGISAALINYNKFLIVTFPHAMPLATCHMLSSFLFCLVLYNLVPGWFPAMKQLEMEGRRLEVLKYFIPIGLCFAMSLYCGTRAFLYCSVAFLQFMKESNIVLIFLLSCAAGLQTMDRIKVAIVLWIISGSVMCVTGEVNFVLFGFALQICAQVCECMKNVAGEFVLSNLKLDPLTYIMFMSPVALSFLCVGCVVMWNPAVPGAFMQSWHLILPSCVLAVALNVAVASVLKNCSSMGFTVSGLVKDIIIVVVSAFIYRDVITQLQFVGFAVTLSGCAAWANIKMQPQGTTASALGLLLGLTADEKSKDVDENEKAPLIADEKGKGSTTSNI